MATLFTYSHEYTFFNSETGNFVFFRAEDTLVLAEIISIEENAPIPWKGVEFDIQPDSSSSLALSGLTCFFDSTLSLPQPIAIRESLHAIDQKNVWNLAVLDCDYHETYEVSFLSDTMQLKGVCFMSKS